MVLPLRRLLPLIAVLSIALVLIGCASNGNETATPSTTTSSTTTSSTATASMTLTIETVVEAAQARLDAKFAASEHPDGVLGAIELLCDDSGPVEPGDVFGCLGKPRTRPDFPLDPVGVVFYVIDDDGTSYSIEGTDVPDTTATLRALHDEAPAGLFCRDLLDDSVDAGMFSAAGRPPVGGFFWSLVYWSLEGRPARMDEDGNGVPCESLYDPAVVSTVLAGN